MKQSWKPGTMVYPVPAALVSCGDSRRSNLVTVAWTGTICTNPAMTYISLRPERYSHAIISEQMEFTINLTTAAMARAVDWCGVRSGRDCDKWAATGLTPTEGVMVRCPAVAESPLSVECRVRQIVSLGSHDMFMAEVVNILADDRFIDPATGTFHLSQAGMMAWSHGHYWSLADDLGHFGFSVRKKKNQN